MAPTLLPGDWLLADPDAYRAPGAAWSASSCCVPDPRQPARLLVKRVAGVDARRTPGRPRRRPGGIDRLARLRRRRPEPASRAGRGSATGRSGGIGRVR